MPLIGVRNHAQVFQGVVAGQSWGVRCGGVWCDPACACCLAGAMPIRKATIMPRGHTLGMVRPAVTLIEPLLLKSTSLSTAFRLQAYLCFCGCCAFWLTCHLPSQALDSRSSLRASTGTGQNCFECVMYLRTVPQTPK